MVMERLIFGNDNAEVDDLLYQCEVSTDSAQKPILTGRWGTGKTAVLFLRHQALAKALLQPDKPNERPWYIEEKNLDVQALLSLRQKAVDREVLVRYLERIWSAEILRSICAMLCQLWAAYGSPTGSHWQSIKKIAHTGVLNRSFWQRLPEILSLISGDEIRGEQGRALQDSWAALSDAKACTSVQNCLADIKGHPLFPSVAIEPIETPTSPVEEQPGLAQPLIIALLNLFQSSLQPSDTQLIRVSMSIPWHRCGKDGVNMPQKLLEYGQTIKWTRNRLKEFINRRIEWEFRRVGRSIGAREDAWSCLFEPRVHNDHGNPSVAEDSFDYVLRHTHHRARDLQQIARQAVDCSAESRHISADDVILVRGGTKISGATIRRTLQSFGPEWSQLLLIEGGRRYADLRRLVDSLTGMAVPFDFDNLQKRAAKVQIDPLVAVDTLWDTGLLGVFLCTESENTMEEIKSSGIQGVEGEGYRSYTVDRRRSFTWSLFEYNCYRKPMELLSRYAGPDEGNAKLILHPKMFDVLLPRMKGSIPYGA